MLKNTQKIFATTYICNSNTIAIF